MVTQAAEPTTRLVEFRGLPNPRFEPSVQAMEMQGLLTEGRRKELRKLESKRQMQGFARLWPPDGKGGTVRRIGTKHGMSRDYVWSPANRFRCEMTIEDIARLHDTLHDAIPDPQKRLDMKLAHQRAFIVLGEIIRV